MATQSPQFDSIVLDFHAGLPEVWGSNPGGFVCVYSPSLLQRVSIACYAERCISYNKSVRLSVRLSVTRWH